MKKPISLLLLNSLSLLFALIMNGLSGAAVFDGKTVGAVSKQYNTLIAPDGYAFAIWGLIYLFLIMFVCYQWYSYYILKQESEIKQTGLWLSVANIANGLWIVAWLNEAIGISVLLIFMLLVSLIVLTVRLRLEIWDAPKRTIIFIWWPAALYLGWIIVASVSNVAAFLVSLNWQGGFLSESMWTIIMIGIASIIYLWLVFSRNLRESAVVGIWAFIAIAVRHWNVYSDIAIAALIGAGILMLVVLWHAFKNRKHSPFLPS
ncbi:MAG: hypothetical protein IH597_02730 [Bacteroidales bacterium]|nr:hypothetical protein [Bacteroidales bacterium]